MFKVTLSLVAKLALATPVCLFLLGCSKPEVKLLDSVKISDSGLFFDGIRVPVKDRLTVGDGPQYDYAFGARITPHGDCVEVYGKYVFMTWYKGPESERNVMLSRYDTEAGTLATIEFEHRHTGFQNRPHIGESHNTIAVGICPLDDTIHLLYDMHSYGPTKPEDGSLAEDYFRYQVSEKGAASVPDAAFTRERFGPKRLYLKEGVDYTHLTYPFFHTNQKDELFVRIRRGGHNNGKYMLAKYDGHGWSDFWDFNVLDAGSNGHANNWGLYGDLKFENGKLRAGFETRLAIEDDKYKYNNGFYYAYSDDPEGRGEWRTHDDRPVSLPILDPAPLKFIEPGDVFPEDRPNSVWMSQGPDWTVTEDDSLHFVNNIELKAQDQEDEDFTDVPGETKHIHAFKKKGDAQFSISTDFPGGELHAIGSTVYLIGLEEGRPYVYAAPGGTNDWRLIFQEQGGPRFRHGNLVIRDGKLYFFLMEGAAGSAQPIYLQVYDLGI